MVNGDQCETMERLNYIITKGGPFDVVIIDQLDKMQVRGTFARDDLRLSQVYIKARTLAKKHNIAVIAVSQAGAEADGRTSLRFTQMANSKIGKAAEADVIIGIGKENTETQDDNFLRYLHVSKNKLGGSHGRATVRIEPKISRYVD
jgi:replicative DNA helicase